MLSSILQFIIMVAIATYFIWIGTVTDFNATAVSTADLIAYCITTTIAVCGALLHLTILITKGK